MATRRSKKREPEAKRELHYKVVELSSVDEATLERTLNEWTPRGWKFDGVQFAMRESSKRPSMAFMFFTREGPAISTPAEVIPHLDADNFRDPATADAHLKRLADGPDEDAMSSAWERLHLLAEDKGES